MANRYMTFFVSMCAIGMVRFRFFRMNLLSPELEPTLVFGLKMQYYLEPLPFLVLVYLVVAKNRSAFWVYAILLIGFVTQFSVVYSSFAMSPRLPGSIVSAVALALVLSIAIVHAYIFHILIRRGEPR